MGSGGRGKRPVSPRRQMVSREKRFRATLSLYVRTIENQGGSQGNLLTCGSAARIRWRGHRGDFRSPKKRGGLNGSTQHLLTVHVQEFTKLNSIKGVDSNKRLPCLGSD